MKIKFLCGRRVYGVMRRLQITYKDTEKNRFGETLGDVFDLCVFDLLLAVYRLISQSGCKSHVFNTQQCRHMKKRRPRHCGHLFGL